MLGIFLTANSKVSYLTWGPKRVVRTSFAGEYGAAMKIGSKLFGLVAESPDAAVEPIIGLIANPPVGRHAYRGKAPVPLVHGPNDTRDVERLLAAVESSIS